MEENKKEENKENVQEVSKNDNLQENSEQKETKQEQKEISEEQKEVSEEGKEYVLEQLDDDDFEKEKNMAKEEKKAKKLANKAKKENKKIKYDENGNPIKKKKSKAKIIVTVLLLAIIIIGIAAYFVISFNQPENVVQDFAIYLNNSDWENVANCVDMQGYLTMFLVDAKNYEDDEEADETDEETSVDETETEETTEEETEESTTVSYADYDNMYDTAYDEVEELGYDYMIDIIEYGEKNLSDCLENYSGYTFTIESIKSVEKIGNTESLYKVTFICTIMATDGEEQTGSYSTYVAKKDGEYKIVYGEFADVVFQAYYYTYLYTYYYGY